MTTDTSSSPSSRSAAVSTGLYWAILVILVLVVLLVLNFSTPDAISFVPDTPAVALQVLTGLLLVALFAERANEVIFSNTRKMQREAMQQEIDWLRSVAEGTEESSTRMAEIDKIAKLEDKLRTFRSHTKAMTLGLSLVVATVISLAGVRALSPLLDVQFDSLANIQSMTLQFADIIVTAALIGGGASGIHKIISKIGELVD